MKTVIVNAHVISPGVDLPCASVEIVGGRIVKVAKAARPAKSDWVFDAKGAYVVPGFIDVHLHGACGYDVCDATPEAIEKIAEAKLAEGCTSFLPTTLTVGHGNLIAAAKAVAAYRKNPTFSKVIGIHLEGPFINVKCCGAQNPKFVRKPDMKEVLAIDRISPVKQISFAPEQPGGAAFAAACLKRGIVPSCGHTGATMAEFMPAYKKGLRHMTHFCNQMTPLHHRDIGMVGAGLLLGDTVTELICDLIHVSAPMVKLIFQVKDCDHVMLISDAMRAAGMPDGSYTLGGLPVTVQNGAARLSSNGALAGSTLAICDALKNVVSVTGLPLSELVKTTSFNAAREHKLAGLGKIEPGYTADLVLLSDDFKVRQVFIDGTRCL